MVSTLCGCGSAHLVRHPKLEEDFFEMVIPGPRTEGDSFEIASVPFPEEYSLRLESELCAELEDGNCFNMVSSDGLPHVKLFEDLFSRICTESEFDSFGFMPSVVMVVCNTNSKEDALGIMVSGL